MPLLAHLGGARELEHRAVPGGRRAEGRPLGREALAGVAPRPVGRMFFCCALINARLDSHAALPLLLPRTSRREKTICPLASR